MATIRIDLQDGFRGEPVVVSVDGHEVMSWPSVTTSLAIARADGIESDVEPGPHTVLVEIPGTAARAELEVDVEDTVYVEVDRRDGGLVARAGSTEPRYL